MGAKGIGSLVHLVDWGGLREGGFLVKIATKQTPPKKLPPKKKQ